MPRMKKMPKGFMAKGGDLPIKVKPHGRHKAKKKMAEKMPPKLKYE